MKTKQKISPEFEEFIKQKSSELLEDNKDYNLMEPENSDSIAEILEKLIINSIRVWHLEDLAKEYANDDAKLADLKRKIDYAFKNVRPRLLNALDKLFHDSVVYGHPFKTENVKVYKGFNN